MHFAYQEFYDKFTGFVGSIYYIPQLYMSLHNDEGPMCRYSE